MPTLKYKGPRPFAPVLGVGRVPRDETFRVAEERARELLGKKKLRFERVRSGKDKAS